jgi:deferrochelatase/peroxidase EfeB
VHTPTAIDFADVQANILRGVNTRHARHFMLAGSSVSGTAQFIGALLGGTGLRISTAAPWADKPDYHLTLGLTAPGLEALGLPPALLASFPDSFTAGAARRAESLGDTGTAAPSQWAYGGQGAEHLVVSLYTDEQRMAVMDARSRQLRGLVAQHGLVELGAFDANAFEHGAVHFGYRDGIAQPRIEGVPSKRGEQQPDMQPMCKPGEFLLGKGYVNQFQGNWLGDVPHELGDNASYGVLRMIRQEVATFEELLQRVARRYAVDPEWVAAKLMGRWRNGVPLTLTHGAERPGPMPHEMADLRLNDFDYAPTPAHPAFLDDREGLRCPIGSHIRRLNPRSALVMGKPHTRRLIRRAMPYGPAWQAGQAADGIERGLIGYFVCGDVESQFEFLLQTWANRDFSTHGLRGTREPILGFQPGEGGRFVIRTENSLDPIVIDDLPQLTFTRGCLYCFLPGIGGLHRLAALA